MGVLITPEQLNAIDREARVKAEKELVLVHYADSQHRQQDVHTLTQTFAMQAKAELVTKQLGGNSSAAAKRIDRLVNAKAAFDAKQHKMTVQKREKEAKQKAGIQGGTISGALDTVQDIFTRIHAKDVDPAQVHRSRFHYAPDLSIVMLVTFSPLTPVQLKRGSSCTMPLTWSRVRSSAS